MYKYLAVLACVGGLATAGNAATVSVDFTDLGSGTDINLGGDFVADDLRIVNGNCIDGSIGSGAPCAALNRNETTTISRSSGLEFMLSSFWYQLLGANAELEVSYFDADGSLLGSDFFEGPVDGNNDGGNTVIPSFTGDIYAVLFDNPGDNPGNVRIDDLAFEVATDVAPIPLPAGVWLLLTSLGGLAYAGRRKKA